MTDTAEQKLTPPRAQREREAAEAEAAAAANGDTPATDTDGDAWDDEAARAGLTDEQYQYCVANNIDSTRILEWFGGKPVTGVVLEVTHAGAGLEEGLTVAPILHSLESRASIILDGHHDRISYKAYPKRDAELVRVERFYTESGLYVDPKIGAKQRRELQQKIEAHKAENGGDVPVPGLAEAGAAAEE